jgi:uncharacterized membrane protein YsdA (DUF1294 family)
VKSVIAINRPNSKEVRSTSQSTVLYPRALRFWFWFCVVVAIGVVLRRLKELIAPSVSSRAEMAELEAAFSSHAVLTAAHIVPAAVFVLCSVFVLSRMSVARLVQWLFFVSGWITGLTAYAMSFNAFGGWIERSAVMVFDTWFLYSLTRAYRLFLNKVRAQQKKWSIRAVGVLLGIAATRPVMGIFFATQPVTHLVPRQFFGIAFWIGFLINTAITEVWLRTGYGLRSDPSRDADTIGRAQSSG